MKLGIVIYSNDPETLWNAFRLGVFSSKKEDDVKIFLLGGGVESDSLDTEKFHVTEVMRAFIDSGGEILACGTCLKIRQSDDSELCSISTLTDLYGLISESDKVLTF